MIEQANANQKTIPGPQGSPTLRLLTGLRRDRLKYVRDTALQYGDIVQVKVLRTTIYQVNHPDAIQHVLQDNNKNYHKGFEALPTMEMTLGRGLLTNEGDAWLRQRRLMAPVFHRRNIDAMSTIMTRRAGALADKWQQADEGKTVNVAAAMMELALDIVSEALFSTTVTDRAAQVADAVTVMTQDAILRFDFPFYPAPNIPTPHNRHYLRALRALDEIVYGLIRQRRAEPGAKDKYHDLLQLLLDAQDDESRAGMDDKQLRDELITLFLAGHETTANLLAWTFYLLAQHPEVQARVVGEISTLPAERLPEVADLPQLVYTRRVLDEVMRLYPPAWVINRISLAPDELCGYPIPAHAFVAILPWIMHRHPRYWENPDEFDPDRFLPERAAERPRFVYFPFGGGPRLCIGRDFALVEAQLVLATLLRACKLELDSPRAIVPEAHITLRPKGGLPMRVMRR